MHWFGEASIEVSSLEIEVSPLPLLAVAFAWFSCGVFTDIAPAYARKISPSERALLERALNDMQHTRELQTLETLARRIRRDKGARRRNLH